MSAASRLKALLDGDELIVVPGAYDGLTARLVELADFPAVYATGAGISNSQLGLADVGLATMSELLDQVRKMVGAVRIPLIADIDTGFGNAVNVHRTIGEFSRAGVAAVQIEDQDFPKRCGHFEGKSVVPMDEMVAKLKAAVEARGEGDMMIIARTDAIATEGFSRAMERAKAYHAAGADILFVEAPRSGEEIAAIGRELPGYKLLNIVEGGKTPTIPSVELKRLGFHLALYANLVLRSSVHAVQKNLAHLKRAGDSKAIENSLISMAERARVTNKLLLDDIEQRFVKNVSQALAN